LLSLEPVSRQIIDRYAVLKKYFLTELPKYEKTMISSTKLRCEGVRLAFEDPVTLVYLNWLERGKKTIGCGTEHTLQSVQDSKCNGILLEISPCLKITTAYLQKHLPISNPVLCDLQCPHPLARKRAIGQATVGRLCQHLKKVSKTDILVDKVDAEWLLYMASKEVDAFPPQITADICTYWSNVCKVIGVNGSRMFLHLLH
jgi:hypothetical protein